MKVIEYDDKYRDDMIFMVLEAKDALGVYPRLNNDLLDIKSNYFDEGTKFWLALDDNDRVVGCIGYVEMGFRSAKLHRFYVKASMKRQGIGSQLLKVAEDAIINSDYREILAHLGGSEFFESKEFYAKKGYTEYQPSWVKKIINS